MHGFVTRFAPALLLVFCAAAAAAPQISTRSFFEDPQYRTVKISPDGKHLAVVMPNGDGREMLVFIDLANRKVAGSARFTGSNTVVHDFMWVSDDRVVIETATKYFGFDAPLITGDLYGVNADGGDFRPLIGPNIRNVKLESAAMTKRDTIALYGLMNPLLDESRYALIWSKLPTGSDWSIRWAFPIAMRLDVISGRATNVVKGPVQGGELHVDFNGVVRFADGLDESRSRRKLLYRDPESEDWRDLGEVLEALGDEDRVSIQGVAEEGVALYAIGDAGDAQDLFRIGIDGKGAQSIAHRSGHDVEDVVWSADRKRIVAVEYWPARFERVYLDPEEERAKLLRMLEKSFPGDVVRIASATRDRKLAVVYVSSDVNSGDYYLFDTRAKKVEYLFSRYSELDPEMLAPMEPVALKARDGVELRGYLTVPKGVAAKQLPLVVLVHGGPHGIRDYWGFDPEAQFLANRGYAVLQLNYRGSGGYGPKFLASGYKRWGAEMQDDLTDATRWAIAQGIADPKRICIAGASYGGYASLMGVVREPDLYKCAFGYVGVYDLPLMYGQGDIPESKWGTSYLRKALGTDEADLKRRSSVYNVDKIKAAIFLAHGGKDERAHPEHYRRLKAALDKAGKPYEDLWKENEGHGFLNVDNRVELYDKLAAFLARHIGTGAGAP
jgi:dipeptidyl aminopeptidase/acylaminoacyl peptidase